MQGAGIIEWNNFGLFSQLHKSRIRSVARYASVSELVHSKKYPRKFAQELQVRSTSVQNIGQNICDLL